MSLDMDMSSGRGICTENIEILKTEFISQLLQKQSRKLHTSPAAISNIFT